MKPDIDIEQFLENNTSHGSPHLDQDREERKEKRGNRMALTMLAITALFLVLAAYKWYSVNRPRQNVTMIEGGEAAAPAPNNPPDNSQ